jgi:hypothetical protein
VEDHDISARAWVDQEDYLCRTERIERLAWLAANHPPVDYSLIPGGILTNQLFEESRLCFVYGQFCGSLLLSIAFIERVLAAHFYGAGRDDLKRAGIQILADEALKLGLLSKDEYDTLETLRTKRNPLVHFREYGHKETIDYSSVFSMNYGNTPISPEEIIANDAVEGLRMAFHFLARLCTPDALARFITIAKKR